MIFKHIDFQVPGFGELAQPPTVTSGTPGATPVLLDQDAAAGFSDHGPGAVGLHATLSAGLGDGHIEHALPAPAVLHARVVLAPRTAVGGSVRFAGGSASDGTPRWWLSLDADTRAVSLNIPGHSPITATLSSALDWHTVEVRIDSAVGAASLRVNGVPAGGATGLVLAATERAWLGARDKPTSMTGQLALDGWVLADEPVGPARVLPNHDHAGDPARWLVVYNADHTGGAEWAEYYRAERGVPYANLCGLALPMTETVSAAQYLALRDQVLAYLSDNGLVTRIVGVLLGLGVPGYVDWAGDGDRIAVSSLMHTDASNDAVAVNGLHRDPVIDRPTHETMAGLRFTGRVDGATIVEAKAWIDRATALMQSPPTADAGGTCWLDPVPEDGGVNPLFTAPMQAWADGPGPGKLRLPLRFASGGVFDTIDDDFAFWGWGQAEPPAGFFTEPSGRRALCVQLEAADPPAADQRDPAAAHWLRRAFDAGYAAASASSRPYTLSALPQPGVFFDVLRRGWTLAEAWLLCQPFTRSGMHLLGDPLLTLAMPKSGYDVYGPAEGLEAIDTDAPAARLPVTERSLTLDGTLLPADGTEGRYLVRRIDGQGRPDGGSASAHVYRSGEKLLPPAPPPSWPDYPGWPARVSDGIAQAVAVWPSSQTLRVVGAVELEAERPGGATAVLWSGLPDAGARDVVVEGPLPEPGSRLRWRVHHRDGALAETPWSAALHETDLATADLPLYEVLP